MILSGSSTPGSGLQASLEQHLMMDRALSFITEPTLEVAKQLLGTRLTTSRNGAVTSGMIVEVEAYHGDMDPACHCYYRRTERNEVMFWEAGACYVYLIYGMHYCVNVVTEQEDTGAAVLIRAIEPLEGIAAMERRRKMKHTPNLTNGPAKLCQAMKIDKRLVGENFLDSDRIWLEPYLSFSEHEIVQTTRIGISKGTDLPWRFYLANSRWVSKRSA